MAKRSRTAAERAGQAKRLRTRPARAQMLTAARELATARGYESLRAGDIASAAGVSRETFYTHFADKRSCLAEATEPRLGEIESKLRIALEESEPWASPILESLEAALRERYGSKSTPRARIIEAMLALVAERGYAALRLADVIKAARVSYPTFYRHFESKQECFTAAYETMIARLETQVAEELEERGSSAAQAATHLTCLADLLAAEPTTARILVLESGQLSRHESGTATERSSFAQFLGRLVARESPDPNEATSLPIAASSLSTGAALELIRSAVVANRVEALPENLANFARLHESGAFTAPGIEGRAAAPSARGRRPGSPRARARRQSRSTRAGERKPLTETRA